MGSSTSQSLESSEIVPASFDNGSEETTTDSAKTGPGNVSTI